MVPQLFLTCMLLARGWMRERAELFSNHSVPGHLIPSGCMSSGSSSSTGCCSDRAEMGSGTSSTVSSAMGITHLRKLRGSGEHTSSFSSFPSIAGLGPPSVPHLASLLGELTSFLAFLAKH